MAGVPAWVAPAVAVLLACVFGGVASAQGSQVGGTEASAWGWTWEAELTQGYGQGVDLSSVRDMGDVRFLGFFPRIGRSFRRGRGETASARRFRVLAEVPILVARQPRRGYGVGLTALGRYAFGPWKRAPPQAGAGGGAH
jgi:hypothetical protein